MKDKKEGIKRS